MKLDNTSVVERVLSGRERNQVLVEWNATEREYPCDHCIHELFEMQAATSPDATAVAHENAQLNYAELNERANRLARHLRALGVKPDMRVALCVERSLEMVVGLLAVLKAGAAYVPLEPSYPVERLSYMLGDCAPAVVLTHARLDGQVQDVLRASGATIVDLIADAQFWDSASSSNLDRAGVTPAQLAYVIYTSGSTGQPKGVMVEHRSLANLLFWMQATYGLGPDDAVLQKTPFSFDPSVWGFFLPLLNGARLVMARAEGHKDPDYLVRVIREQHVTMLHFVPSMLELFLENGDVARCSSLKHVLSGGEVLSGALARRFRERLPQATLHNMYGPAEAAVDVTTWVCTPGPLPDNIPIGRAIANVRTYILDTRGEPVSIGGTGELYIGGIQVARGYLNRPELTAERFIPSPFVKGDRLYKTGDLARYLPDGNIDFLGRNDFQVKIRGFRIELGEIEACLARHEAVGAVIVMAREDVPGEKRLVAYYTPATVAEEAVGIESLRAHAIAVLPEYMVPSAYVMLDSLPLTPNGKLDRKALPIPGAESYVTRAYESPSGDLELAIARIWCDLLRVPQIGRQDNFFDLGGHSLLAIRIVSKLRQMLGVELSLSDFFAHPTLSDFATVVSSAANSTLPAIQVVDREGPLPLSFAQRRLWFLAQLDGVSEAYHIPLALRMHGKPDRDALRWAFDRIVARHEALRTTFKVVDGEPVQQISPADSGMVLVEHDLRKHDDSSGELERIAEQEAISSFDLVSGPLIRGRLITIDDDEHVLLITMHHIASDGWSRRVLFTELNALYRGYREDGTDPLPALSIQYADYAVWQRGWFSDEMLQEQVAYWQRALANAPPLLEVPTDRPRPAQQDHCGARISLELGAGLTAKLKALSHRHGTTLFMTLLTGWGALLARLSGQDDVVVGTPIANRTMSEVEELIGFFVNTVALRLDFSGNPTVSRLLDRVKTRTLEAQQHQDLPFEQVVEATNPSRSIAYAPLFQVMFVWQNNEIGEVELPGLTLSPVETPYATAKFDLTLSLAESDGQIVGSLEYATALFDRSTIERYLEYLRALFAGMVADDELSLCRLNILPDSERQQVLVEWNDTAAPYRMDRCVHELFEEQVTKTPAAIALVYDDTQMTYAKLNAHANHLAHHLRSLGVKPETRVALCVERSPEMVVGLLAVLKAGGAYVPMDPAYPVERLRFMLADSSPIVVLTHAGVPTAVQQVLRRPGVTIVDLVADARQWEATSTNNPERSELTPGDLAYVIYTSGSTGQPKGVLVQHGGICNLAVAQARTFAVGGDSRVLQFASSSFDACIFDIVMAICHGAALCVPPGGVVLAGQALVEVVDRYGITHATLPPAVLNALPTELDLKSVRTLVVAGEAPTAALVRRWAPGRRLINAYGPTESTVWATSYECDPNGEGAPPIGRPIANARIYIVDVRGEPVPIGVAGELCIGGAGIARGYLNRPELTAKRFFPSPFVDGDRLYKTGDLARYLPDGNIEFLGRNDFQVKIRGFRIELGEIEARLALYAGIREAVVLARDDAPGEKRLVAYYTLAPDAGEVGVDALRAHLLAALPEYMVPAAYIALDALPLTSNGKLDRKALPAPGENAFAARAYEAPSGEMELAIAQMWSEFLKLERVGRHDNFFELGGHSLLAVRIISRLRQRFGVEVSLSELFAHPVLGKFAAFLAKATRSALPEIVPISRDATLPLSFAQQRLWFLSQMHSVSQAYHIPLGLRLQGALDRDALRWALNRILGRHEVLRTTFPVVDGEPVQRIAPAAECMVLLEHDLRQSADAQDELARLAMQEATAPFDLATGPLIRGRLIEIGSDEHALLITMHHIVSDGWSMGVFAAELSTLYRAYREGGVDPLPALTVQYADYAAWQRRWLTDDALQKQTAYWHRTLESLPGLLEVPMDRSRPAQQGHAGARIALHLDAKLTVGLKALSQRHGTTLFMTLIAAWGVLLARLSGQEDVVIGTPVANRNGTEVEELIGFFVNTVVMRLDFSGNPTVSEMLARVRARALQAQQHQELPFEQVVESVNPPRSLAHTPLFQVMFAWQNTESTALTLPGLHVSSLDTPYGIAKFDLTLSLAESDGEIVGTMGYATSLFDGTTIDRHLGYLRCLLVEMLANDERNIECLALLPAAERRQVLVDWNATERAYSADRCIHELFEEQVARAPDAIAVVHEGEQLSYGQMNAQANRLAQYLQTLGVKPDSRVAVCVERSLEMVVGLLAVLKAGGAYVPLDPSYPIERLSYMLEDSAPVVVLTHGRVPSAVHDVLRASGVAMVDLVADAQRWDTASASNPERSGLTPKHLAYVIYTSGSTGQPKGVMNEHGALVNRLSWMQERYGLGADDAVLQKTPFSFDVSVWEFFWPLLNGAKLVMARADGHKDPYYLASIIREQRITTMHFVPSMLHVFLEHDEAATGTDLKRVLCSGEALPGALARRFRERLPHVELHNLYGPTEAAIDVTAWACDPEVLPDNIPIGRPISNIRVYILDPHGEPVAIGVAGELYIGGVGVARGYLNRPELTGERFVPSPFVDGDRLYKTGDLVRYLPDGTIEYLGRNDFQVKIRGFRIELGEIEARLAQYSGIREAVVLAREDAPGEKRLVAYYTTAPDAGDVSVDALREHLLATLPEYMVPSAYVALDALPLTPNGKLDRKGLPAPDGTAYAVRAYEAPSGEAECAIAEIWCEVLKLDRVGRHDNFFELGGHSLLVVRLIERMRRVGLHAGVQDIFTSPTLVALTKAARSESGLLDVPANGIAAGCEVIAPEMLTLASLNAEQIARVVGAVPGGAANVQDIYPLAPLQEGILFHHLLESNGDPYLLRVTYRFDSRTRVDRFLFALQAVIDRHDILRTAVVWEGLPEAMQVVWRHAALVVEEVAGLDPARGDVAAQLGKRFDSRHYRIDVRQAPLLRVAIAPDAVGEGWAMVLLFHHLALDHTALDILLQEVKAHLLERSAELPIPLPFRNFVAQTRLGVGREEHEAFFREMLGDLDEPTVPFGLTDVQGDGSAIAQARLAVDAVLAKRLRVSARALGVSVASICHLAWARVLGAVSGRDDVVFGTVLFGRMQGGEGSDRVLGLFINTLPVRVRVSDAGVEQSVRETHTLLAQLLRHEHASLALAQRCSAVAAPAPLFSALLNYRHISDETSSDDHGAWAGIEFLDGEERTNYPLALSVNDFGEAFSLTAQVHASVDPDRVCGFMNAALEQLVEALERAPATPMCRVNVLPETERHRVLVEWNDTAAPYPSDRCVHELFEEQAANAPDAIALVYGDAHLTYAGLNAQANRLAHHLQTLGVKPDVRVAILLDRSIELVLAELAILKCGGAYVPLDLLAPTERQAFMMEDCNTQVLLSVKGQKCPEGAGVKRVNLDELSLTEQITDNLAQRLGSETPAYVMYTSGSTGQPKGVIVPHRAIGRLVLNNSYAEFEAADRVAFAANPAFDASTMEVWAPLLNGGCIVILDRATVLAPASFRQALQTYGVNVLWLTSGLFNQYVDALADVFSSLRYLIIGGDVLDAGAVARVLSNCPPEHLLNGYGPTETTTFAVTHEIAEVTEDLRSIPIGRPIGNTRVYILDAHREPVPIGIAGELYIGGAGVARGYLNRPELTAERFIASPFVAGDRLYKTGDLVRYLPDGNLEFVGRSDFQVKIRGFRIELGEIEARLGQYAGVRDAVVLAREDVPGARRLVAYYTLAAVSGEIGVDTLRAHLSAVLPEYMVPAAYMALDALPLTPNGKVDRKALPEPGDTAYAMRAYAAPLGETELAIAQMWCELLKVERVGREDNFFELGGHSLLVVRLIERMRQAELHVDVRAVFNAPTLAGLATAAGSESALLHVPANLIPVGCEAIDPEMLTLASLTADEIARIVATVSGGAANVQDIYPLAPLQEGFLFHHLLESDGDPYLTYDTMRFDSRTRVDTFLSALQAVIDRHDILRTAVLWEGLPEAMQVVWRRATLVVEEVVDLDPAHGDIVQQLSARFDPRHYRIDVRQAPLLRVAIAPDAVGESWALVLLFHHLALDHTTLDILLQEVKAHLLGQSAELPAPLPFRNFVAQTRLGVSREEHEMFFRGMLGDLDEPTAPFGLTDVQGDGSAISQARLTVDASLAKRLRANARALGVSVASICHLAWARVLGAVSGRDDVVFGTVLFGRMHGGEGSDRVLGLFINTLPVRIRVSDASVEQSVRETHTLLAQLLRHEHASLALAQRCSAVAAPTPLFSALLNYRHISDEISSDDHDAWAGIEFLDGKERTNYPLTLSVNDFGEAFSLTAQVHASVDPGRVCGLMNAALEQLVEALERAPGTPMYRVNVLSAAERQQVLVEWNDTATPYPADRCIHELFEAQAVNAPEAIAAVYEDAHLTYAELNARANRLAHHLQTLGVKPDVRVALCVERGLEMVIGLLAVLKAGGAYVPMDPAYPVERLSYMLADSAPVVVLTHTDVSSAVHEVLHVPGVAVVDLVADAQRWATAAASNPERSELAPNHLAYVIYTSGSTGLPKGVMVEHAGVCNLAIAQAGTLSISAGSRVLQFASSSFDACVFDVVMAVCHGASLYLPAASVVLAGQALTRTVERYGITHATLPPAVLNALPAELDLKPVRVLVVAGEAPTEVLVRRWAPGRRLINAYGPTESTVWATLYECDPSFDGSPPIGRPIANARIYVVDAHGQPVPIGVAGELYIGGAGVARGYLNRPELTAERFVPSPFVVGDRLYKTGDLARHLPDGNIEFLGRNDFQVKIRGFRIELGEIEARLAQYAGIREAVVLAREDSPGERRLVAYFTLAPDRSEVGIDALRAHLLTALPEYMVPSAYVALEVLPLTPNGKLDRKALPAPDGTAYAVRTYEVPQGETELAIAQMWSELLKIGRVGRHDNFFELGGHSLLVVRLIERMRKAGLHADVRAVFSTPTLAGLADAVRDESSLVAVPTNRIPDRSELITPEMLTLASLTAEEIACIVRTVPGGAANVQDIYPLAPLQEGILFHHLLESDGDPYLTYNVMRFDSRVRLDGFLSALQAVIDRHDILRTAVLWEGLPEAMQVVWRHAALIVEEVVDLDPTRGDVVAQLNALFDPRHNRIDVGRAPLLRVAIAPDAVGESWAMALLFHHLALDHTTLDILLQEVKAHLLERSADLPTPLPFRSFVAQARLGVSSEEHEAFFRGMLGDVDEPTVPYGLTDVRGDGSAIGQARKLLDSNLVKRLRASARALGVSVASICHLAWARVLGAVSGRDDVVFGTVLFGRMQGGEGSDRVLGLFINTLPVRIRASDASVEQSVRQTHALLAQLLRHEHASLALAQRCSAVQAPTPLFSALLNYRHISDETSSDGHDAWSGIEFLDGEERTNYPLTFSVNDFGEALGLTAQVHASVDPELVCELMNAALERLVEALERAPATPMSRVNVIPEKERQRILVEWNDTATPYPADRCIHELFEDQAANAPGAIAVVYEDAQLTYAELNAQANRLAHHLRSLGVKPDMRVALCVERSPDMVVGLLAVLKAGGAYVPMDPAYPVERLSYMLADSGPAVVLMHTDVSSAVRDVLRSSGAAIVDIVADAQQWATASASNPERSELTPEHLAYVIYTSGSTGLPKGVMVEHGNLAVKALAVRSELNFSEGDVLPNLASNAFDISLLELLLPLISGGKTLLLRRQHVMNIAELVLRTSGATFFHAVPSLMEAWLSFLGAEAGQLYPALRCLLVGGEAVSDDLLRKLMARFPRARVVELYGPTEASIVSTFYRADGHELHPVRHCIGRKFGSTRTYVLDRHLNPQLIGVAGELHIGGASIARGYLNRPELTAERFVPSPFVDGDRLYKTGDLARYMPDGNIEFLGRNDFQVKVRGFRIELGEIEARLAQHGGIRDVVVLAREDGPGEKRLVAYYTLALEAGDFSVDALRAHLLAILPEYMVPSAYVVLDALPLTQNGKVDRKALPEPGDMAYAVRAYEEPSGETERAIARIWSGLLKLERVGRQDSFFALGGHSLLAVRVISRLRQTFGVEVSLSDLFAYPVLGDFAAVIAKATQSTLPAITIANRNGPLSLSFAQQRLWFLSQMDGVSQTYHMPIGLRLLGELEPSALRRAIDRIVARHEALRTTFSIVDGEPVQRIAPPDMGFLLLEHDLSKRADAGDELERIAAEEAVAPFDLVAGPLIRGRLITIGEDEHVLLITMHHIVSDGWSMGVLIGELSTLYRAFREGTADPLPSLSIQYADYAAWQRRWLTGEALQEQVSYWQHALEGVPALLEVPTDRPRPVRQDYAGARIGLHLDAELAAGLKALSQRHGATLFMTLMCAWGALLSRLSGQEDVVVGTPVANRTSTEVEELIGFFVNTLALRLDLSGNPTVSEMLDRVKTQVLQAQQHQELPFEQVVEIANPQRSLAHPPLFQAMFVWQNNEVGELALPDLTVERMDTEYAIAKFDLTLSLGESDGQIVGALEYATALFDRETAERYLGYFHRLLAGMLANEDQGIARVPLLSEAERHQVLVGWNDTTTPYPSDRCVHELFEVQVAKTPDATAVVYEDAHVTYGELNAQANRLAHHLRSLGVEPDVRVALCVERSPEMVVGLLAVLKAGGAYVPMDPSYPVERLRYMLADSAPVAILTHANVSVDAREVLRASGVAIVDMAADAQQWEAASERNPERLELTLDHLAYVIYTSGSTGQPKGVMAQHRGLTNYAHWAQQHYEPSFGAVVSSSLSFDATATSLFTPLLQGSSMRLLPEKEEIGGMEACVRDARPCGLVKITPAHLEVLGQRLLQDRAHGSVDTFVVGGEALPAQTVDLWRRIQPTVRIVNEYGPTEATVGCIVYELPREFDSLGPVPIGRPIANTRIYILDAHAEPVPIGVVGELYIGGAGVARGYLNRPELTAERFVASPFVDGDPLYKTGDLARYLPDGNIEFLGRNDFQVKIRGFRIELGEIEARLAQHPGVRETVVLAREDIPGEKRLVAYYTVAAEVGEVAVDALRAHLLAGMPEYMVPSAYVVLDALPLTPNGKIDRKALPEPGDTAYAVRAYEEPLGEAELAIAEIWCELLKLERVGRQDNFFELGGHSLLVVRVIDRLRHAGLHADVQAVFAAPTLAGLAAAIGGESALVEVPQNNIPEGSVLITPDMLTLWG